MQSVAPRPRDTHPSPGPSHHSLPSNGACHSRDTFAPPLLRHLRQVHHNRLFTDDTFQFVAATREVQAALKRVEPGDDDLAHVALRKAVIGCLGRLYAAYKHSWARSPVQQVFDAAAQRRMKFDKVCAPSRPRPFACHGLCPLPDSVWRAATVLACCRQPGWVMCIARPDRPIARSWTSGTTHWSRGGVERLAASARVEAS